MVHLKDLESEITKSPKDISSSGVLKFVGFTFKGNQHITHLSVFQFTGFFCSYLIFCVGVILLNCGLYFC